MNFLFLVKYEIKNYHAYFLPFRFDIIIINCEG